MTKELKRFHVIEYCTGDFGDIGNHIGEIEAVSSETAKAKFQLENNIKDSEIGFYGFSEITPKKELVKEAKVFLSKEEIIKEAWGECWNKLPKEAKEKALKNNGFVSQYFEDLLTIDKRERKLFEIRPKSLQGIENNNGWIKIEEGLPKEQGVYHINYSDGVISSRYFHPKHNDWKDYPNATHYQPIEKPKPPIY